MTSIQPEKGHKKHLLRGIGIAGAAVLVLNSIIGAGIFALPATVSARAGVLSPWLLRRGLLMNAKWLR